MNTIKMTVATLCCLVGVCFTCEATLVQDGKSEYQIVRSKDATKQEIKAAAELQEYIQKISGAELPIVEQKSDKPAIWVGQSAETSKMLGNLDFSTLKDDEIILKTIGDDLILCGDNPRGTRYAVIELLENSFGVRWWAYDATDIPETKTIELPQLDVRYAPEIFSRETFYDLVLRHPDFAVHRRINGHFPGIPEEDGGHITIRGFCHTFDQLLPVGANCKEHPDWYAMRDGKRMTTYSQLCLTNPEVREALLNGAREWLKTNPDTKIISLSQNDNQHYCTCEKCNAFVHEHGNQTDLLIDTINYISDQLKDEYPDLLIETLAYQYTRHAPKTIRPRANLLIRLCSIECDFGRPLDSEANKSFSDDVKDWAKVAPLLFVWNYVTNFTKYYLPHPNWENLANDIRFLVAHNMHGMFEQGSERPEKIADLPELREYLLSKLLWNPNADENAIIEEFLNGYYGPAAPFVAHYIEIMKASIAQHPEYRLICYQTTTAGWLSEDALIAAWDTMQAAKARVENEPKYKERVEFAALPITFALLERIDVFNNKPSLKNIDVEKVLNDAIDSCKKAGTRAFSEPGEQAVSVYNRIARAHGILEPIGPTPKELEGKKWTGTPGHSLSVGIVGTYVFIEEDPACVDKKAARMPSTSYEWAVQYRDCPIGKFDIYAEIRCDADAEGDAFSAGIYNEATKVHHSIAGKAHDIVGKEYKLIKIATDYNLDYHDLIYVAPTKNEATKNIWVDRIILVKKQ